MTAFTSSNSTHSHVHSLIDFAIIATTEVEFAAISKALKLTKKKPLNIETRQYWRCKFPLKGTRKDAYEIVVAQALDMANVDAALIVSDTIHHWSPGAAILLGIAGGTSNDTELGDVVVGTDVYYYERGKKTPKGKKPEPKMYPADATLLGRVGGAPKTLTHISVRRPDKKSKLPRVHTGVIASGELVVADKTFRNQVSSFHRKILAIEMEGYGFSKAAWQSFDQCRHIVIKTICDRAGLKKNDEWQPYAAAVVAEYIKQFLMTRPLEPKTVLVMQSSAYMQSVFVRLHKMDLLITQILDHLSNSNFANIDEVIQRALDHHLSHMAELLRRTPSDPADSCILLAENGVFKAVGYLGLSPDIIPELQEHFQYAPRIQGIAGLAGHSLREVYIKDVTNHRDPIIQQYWIHLPNEQKKGSLLCIPLKRGLRQTSDELLAVLNFSSEQEDAFESEDVRLLLDIFQAKMRILLLCRELAERRVGRSQ